MKVFNRIGWVAVMIPALFACDNYEMPPIIPQTGSDISNPVEGTEIVLIKEGAEDEVLEFTLTAADFGTQGTSRYQLEMDLPGANFEDAVAFGDSDSNFIEVNVAELNEALLAKGLAFGEVANVEFRVKATFDQPMDPIYGKTLTLKITPFDAAVDFPVMYVPGDYQGWDPTNPLTVLYAENFDNKFKGFVHIIGGSREFKLTEGPNWDVNYGDTGADKTLQRDGDNIKVATDGTYELNVDLTAKTYTISDVKRWGIVGSATAGGWDADTPMNAYDKATHSLKITTDLKAGEFKFRANNNWDNNYGGSNGTLTSGGDNIAVASAGNYTITLYFGPEGIATYTLVKN
ncbi:MAG: SusE domain-containing protein [Algoriphagus aquaeductus]|uniref:SusE domain-containing protein n=1 Tax=Algoriphagus aquaeductus TaxID=475299 RepID=UPI00391A5A9D